MMLAAITEAQRAGARLHVACPVSACRREPLNARNGDRTRTISTVGRDIDRAMP